MCVSYCRHLYCHHKYLHRHIHSSPKYHHNLGNPSHHRFYHSLAASGCGRVSGPIQHQQSIASLANISSGDGDEDDIRSWRQLIFWRLTVWGGFFPGPAVARTRRYVTSYHTSSAKPQSTTTNMTLLFSLPMMAVRSTNSGSSNIFLPFGNLWNPDEKCYHATDQAVTWLRTCIFFITSK